MSRYKRLLLLFCCGMLLSLSVSCSIGKEPKDDLLEYLENKYPNDNFTWYCNMLRSEGKHKNDYEIVAFCEKYPDAEIHAMRQQHANGLDYYDNYMAYYFQEPAAEYVHDIAEGIFGECKVFCIITPRAWISDTITFASTPDEFLKSQPVCGFAICISHDSNVDRKLDDEKVEQMQKIISDHGWYNTSFSIDLLSDKEMYDQLQNYDDYGAIDLSDYCVIEMNQNSEYDRIKWSDKHE